MRRFHTVSTHCARVCGHQKQRLILQVIYLLLSPHCLGGNRDSEIAIGAWQPGYTTEEMDNEPRGAVHTFRTALWSAHLGGYCEEILNPGSPECVAKVSPKTTRGAVYAFRLLWGRYKCREVFGRNWWLSWFTQIHSARLPVHFGPLGLAVIFADLRIFYLHFYLYCTCFFATRLQYFSKSFDISDTVSR